MLHLLSWQLSNPFNLELSESLSFLILVFLKSMWQLFHWMVLNLGVSEVSSWLDSGSSFLAGIPQKWGSVPLTVSHQETHDDHLSHYQWSWLIIYFRQNWPGFSTVKLQFFSLKLIKDPLRGSYFHLLLLAWGSVFPSVEWGAQNEQWIPKFSLKDSFIIPSAMDLIYWKILSTKQMIFLKVYVIHFPIAHSSDMSTALSAHKGKACLPHGWMPTAHHSSSHRVGGQQIFVKGLNLPVHHSLWKAFDICSEDTKLINAIQRQRLDILVSLRGFVTGQCSVMKVLKIDWTECMETPIHSYHRPRLSGKP